MSVNSLGAGRDDVVAAYEAAAQFFVETAAQVRDHDLESPALGVWTVRDLLGHTSRALATVEGYLTDEMTPVEVPTAVDYFELALGADPDVVAERGRQAGAGLGNDPLGSVSELASRVVALVRRTRGDARLATLAGTMTLVEYLPTRTFELVVHTCDVATAVDIEVDVPDLAAESTLRLLGALTVRRGATGIVVRALTGREPLPGDFTLL